MDGKYSVVSELRWVWRWSLPTGLITPLVSLLIGILFQVVFNEIAHGIPFVYRQDAHVSLPVCNIFPGLTGCEPGVGALTGLQIWELSQQVGQLGGLLVNVVLVAAATIWLSVRLRSDRPTAGLLTGVVAGISSLALATALRVPSDLHSARGIVGVLTLVMLPLSGTLGGQIGKDLIAKRLSHASVSFQPGGAVELLDWTGEVLSQRELEVLALVAEGLKNQEIARRLYISQATVKTHLIHIYAKLGVDNRTAAVTTALAYGLIRREEELSEAF